MLLFPMKEFKAIARLCGMAGMPIGKYFRKSIEKAALRIAPNDAGRLLCSFWQINQKERLIQQPKKRGRTFLGTSGRYLG